MWWGSGFIACLIYANFSGGGGIPSNTFLLLDGTAFLLLDGTDFLLLGS